MVFFPVIDGKMKYLTILLLQHSEHYMLPCLNKKLFGVDCPGCGLQRSVDLLLHGQFVAAFEMYPAIYPMLLLLIFLGTSLFTKIRHAEIVKWSLIAITVGTVVVHYIIKMNNLFN